MPQFYSVYDGLAIDLRSMKSIDVDQGARRVRAEAGVLWNKFDRDARREIASAAIVPSPATANRCDTVRELPGP